MAAALLSELVAIQSYLEGLQGAASWPVASLFQRDAVAKRAGDIRSLSPQEASDIITKLNAIPWSCDIAEVLTVITGKVGSSLNPQRRILQDFAHLNYYTVGQWEVMAANPSQAEDVIIKHVCDLGLVNPSEKTCQSIAALIGRPGPL